jgi:hypothetical protein
MHSKHFSVVLALGAAVLFAMPVAASSSSFPACGGDHENKKKKDVKKPAPGDDKKPANPA